MLKPPVGLNNGIRRVPRGSDLAAAWGVVVGGLKHGMPPMAKYLVLLRIAVVHSAVLATHQGWKPISFRLAIVDAASLPIVIAALV